MSARFCPFASLRAGPGRTPQVFYNLEPDEAAPSPKPDPRLVGRPPPTHFGSQPLHPIEPLLVSAEETLYSTIPLRIIRPVEIAHL